ncbi:MAG: FAD-dependent oxidoreductase [Clostridia bacterium]|nr:FAD-dependent oxidoreductase [Clostridia bacterium]
MDSNQNTRSLWSDTAALPRFERLSRDIKTDVLIIGGGMAGLLTAYLLDRAGVDYVLVEAERIASGATRNTTAKITSQHGLCYDTLIRRFGADDARLYYAANEAALERYRSLCLDIDCGFIEQDAFVYTLSNRKKLERELAALAQIKANASFAAHVPLPLPVQGAIRFPAQASFHPLRFLSAIAQGLTVYERTPVRELRGMTAITDFGRIQAKKIAVCTHFPFLNRHGMYFLKLYQHRSYVLALEHAANVHGMYVDENECGLSFRNYENLLLLGGGGHRTGKAGGGWAALRAFQKAHYPGAREAYRWAAQDCMSLDGVPYIGRYSPNTPDLFVAGGFNKWGMTLSMVAAMLLCDFMRGRDNPYAPVFMPERSILRPQLAVNAAEAAVSLLTPSIRRCPHLGCALKWNAAERSWDCPCHGSRFTETGRLLDNPAARDLP